MEYISEKIKSKNNSLCSPYTHITMYKVFNLPHSPNATRIINYTDTKNYSI